MVRTQRLRPFELLIRPSDGLVTIVTAPAACAICKPNAATPPVPCSSTVCPGCTGDRPYSAIHAFSAARGRHRSRVREDMVLAEQALRLTTQLRQRDLVLDRVGEDAVAGLPVGDAFADFLDDSCGVLDPSRCCTEGRRCAYLRHRFLGRVRPVRGRGMCGRPGRSRASSAIRP